MKTSCQVKVITVNEGLPQGASFPGRNYAELFSPKLPTGNYVTVEIIVSILYIVVMQVVGLFQN